MLQLAVTIKVILLIFFRIDEDNSDLAYCKICEGNFTGTSRNSYSYTWKDGNTSNMIVHLRDKYGIIKDNYIEYLDEHQVVTKLYNVDTI